MQSSGFSVELERDSKFVFCTDTLQRLTRKQLDWLKSGIDMGLCRRPQEDAILDRQLSRSS